MGITKVHIAFGGNIGHVRDTFRKARADLNDIRGVEVTGYSKLYRSTAVGPGEQPDYLNAVVAIETELEHIDLLDQLHLIEEKHGRIRFPEPPRWSARTLDLDILTYGSFIVELERLVIPHPMMAQRMFVLCPLCDLDPNWHHPLLKMTAAEMMAQLIAAGEPPLPEGEAW
jgi:2-amino-4-hydroxy-6-hydroxymethyldihydropteridine diphosphokinase